MIKTLAVLAGLCAVLVAGFLFMGNGSKQHVDQALEVGRETLEKGKEIAGQVKKGVVSAGQAVKEKVAPGEHGRKDDAESDTELAKNAPEPAEAADDAGAQTEETRPRTASRADNKSWQLLEDAQSILADTGKVLNQ